MLLEPNEEFTAYDLAMSVVDAEIIVTEISQGDKYLSINYYPTAENFMVFFQRDNEDPIIDEGLDHNEAYERFREHKTLFHW